MNGAFNQSDTTAVVPCESAELVKGQEHRLVERLQSLVRRQSVVLDLSSVERIDAAGLAALITLYADACKAGHTLAVSRPSRHVREILQIVGLDRILIARPEADFPARAMQLQESAA